MLGHLSHLASRAQLPEAEAAASFAGSELYTLRVMFAPIIVDLFFAGVLAMQLMSYFSYQKGDRWWVRATVITVAVINYSFTGYLIFLVQNLYVQNFGLWAPFTQTNVLAWAPFIDSLNSFVVQVFMSYRAYRLCNRQILIPIAVFLLCLMSVGATLAVLIIFTNLAAVAEASKVRVPELVWLSSIMTADLIITVSILYGLIRSKTGWAHTDKIVTKLIRMTIESQVPPLCIAIGFMSEFVRTPSNLLGAMFQNMQIKLYAMGLMYSLNSRITFQQQSVADDKTAGGQVYAMSSRHNPRTEIQVTMETETYVQGPYAGFEGDNKARNPDSDSLSDIEGGKNNLALNSQARLTSPEHRI
ncbi:hypothetical protein EHS25_000413 [Saitozyma podzolica]|uniref:DUF6534 domain-containing protein n=1 Tax=Saitozyma podzolica TaxID=1890683 RepID=A0A427YWB1_9TREE|nr:hypothetical protein EHS25_000413 [Saitozyma podzolica]